MPQILKEIVKTMRDFVHVSAIAIILFQYAYDIFNGLCVLHFIFKDAMIQQEQCDFTKPFSMEILRITRLQLMTIFVHVFMLIPCFSMVAVAQLAEQTTGIVVNL